MTKDQQDCHIAGLRLAEIEKKSEWRWIELLIRMHKNKIHLCFEQGNLKNYAMNILKLNESFAICMISVSGKCIEVPALKDALQERAFSVWTARRLVSKITNENAAEFIEFAKHNTHAAIDMKLNPEGTSTRRVKNEIKVLIKRVQSLIAQQTGKSPNLDETDMIVYEAYYRQHHPEEKAKRAAKKTRPVQKVTLNKTVCSNKRTPLTAEQKHAVHLRDGFRCTFVDAQGQRCDADRWLHIHHLKPVSQGGSNEPENLTTLCSAHHDLCHQLTLSLEDQITWLR